MRHDIIICGFYTQQKTNETLISTLPLNSHLGGSGEGNLVHVHVLGDGGAGRVAVARDDVYHTLRVARLRRDGQF